MSIPVLVRSVGPEPSAGYYTQWTSFVPGYPKFKNDDTGVSQALFAGDGVTLLAYRAHYLYFTGTTGQIIDRTIEFDVARVNALGVGEYYDIPVTGYSSGGTGFTPDAGSSSGTAQPTGPAILDVVVTDSFALRTGDARVTPWHSPRFAQERQLQSFLWANLNGIVSLSTPAVVQMDGALGTQLLGQDFGFRLPLSASIVGIETRVVRKGSVASFSDGLDYESIRACIPAPPSGAIYDEGKELVPPVLTNGFVAVSFLGTVAATSPDAAVWTQRTVPISAQYMAGAWNGSVFCVVATGYVPSLAITSPDGITWTQRAMPTSSNNWEGIAWNGSVFCAVSYGSAVAATSPDGITWTQRTLPTSTTWRSIAWNGTVFCALALNSAIAATSPDGITWTQRTPPAGVNFGSIAWNGNVFCAVSADSDKAATSVDGITWDLHTMPISGGWRSVTWNGSVFAVVSYGSSVAATSPDGITWTQRALPSSANWSSLAWNGSVFCAVAYGASTAAVSADGVTWTAENMPAASGWWVVVSGLVGTPATTFEYREISIFDGSRVTDVTTWGEAIDGGVDNLGAEVVTAQEVNDPAFGIGVRANDPAGLYQVSEVQARIHYRGDLNTDTLPAKRPLGLSGVAEAPDGTKIAVGSDGKILRKPANSPTWGAVSSGTTISLNAVEWVGDRFIAVGVGGFSLDGGADGSSWVRVETGALTSLWGIRRVANTLRAVAVGNDDLAFERGRLGGWQT